MNVAYNPFNLIACVWHSTAKRTLQGILNYAQFHNDRYESQLDFIRELIDQIFFLVFFSQHDIIKKSSEFTVYSHALH
jgi:hypothetical protein